jgi:hypothetical protein
MLTRRRTSPERMDDPGVDRAELARSLAFIRAVNRRLGGTQAALGHLRRWLSGWPEGEPVRIIDLGMGSADIPLAVVNWASGRGLRVEVTAVDAHPVTLSLAREHVGDVEGIELVEADCLRLMDRYDAGAFDFVHAGMFLHHLQDIEVLTALRIMDRLARCGVIWNDLVRGPIEKVMVRLLVVGRPEIVRHDGLASVAAGFRKGEALELAERAGWSSPTWHRHLFGRFTVTSEK